ncbi:TPA: hypothetical protein DEB00_00255 [Candidatus Uhrbacteria bacterium]|nr:hypothetical protein [Candidatus Uhrbacteria bacterium]
MNYLLGIDIGGTKYHVRAKREQGRDIDLVVDSKGHLHQLGSKGMVKQIGVCVKQLQKKMQTRLAPAGIALGLAGLDSPKQAREVQRALLACSWWNGVDPARRFLVSDVQIGLRAGTDQKAAIAIISGTGSNGYGIDHDGHEAWVSGRGEVLADQGSGYAIGVACLKAVCKAEDGRGPATKLRPLVFHTLRVQSSGGILNRIALSDFGKKQIADLGILVMEAAIGGDRVAREILEEAAEELALMATTLHRRLHFGREKVDVVMIGGCINKNEEVRRLFLRKLRKESWANPVPLADDPVAGAIKMLQ